MHILNFKLRILNSAALLLLSSSLCLTSTAPAQTTSTILTTTPAVAPRFQQDRFAIGFWVDPPADEKMEQRYKEIADANFTVVIGGFGARNERQIERQLDLCQKFGLKAIVGLPGKDPDKLAADHPALWGYKLYDEPTAAEFPVLTTDVLQMRAQRPGKLAYINLYPTYVFKSNATAEYESYVRQFVDQVHPDVLSMDHYPFFLPDHKRDGRQGYLDNLAVMREHSLRAGIPYWNFFNTMPFGSHSDPTEAQIRWQIYSTIAYGAKGVLYFCYYTPGGGEFPKGGAIIGRDDKPTRHYDQARRINAELKNLGPTLMKLTSTRVAHAARPEKSGDRPATTSTLAGFLIKNLGGSPIPDCLVGEFRHADGRRAVLLMNYDFAYTSWPTVEFDAPLQSITEIDKTTGSEIPLKDDSPNLPGIQLSLDAGDAQLFLCSKDNGP